MISNNFLNHLTNHTWVHIKTISFMYLLSTIHMEIYFCEVPTKSNSLLGKQNSTSILITAVFIVIEYKYLCLKNILENYNTDKRKIFVNCRNFCLSLQKAQTSTCSARNRQYPDQNLEKLNDK